MNETLRLLYERKSVRVFEDRPVSKEDTEKILQAAALAPSAGNQQLYTILHIKNQALKDKLAVTCDYQPFIAKAPLVLIFCADQQKWMDAYQLGGCEPRAPGPGDLMLAAADACIAAQNAATAAESLGLGSCFIGDIMENYELHREMLNLPLWVFPAAMLVIGYPTLQQQARVKPARPALRHLVHEDGYRRMEGEELKEMLKKGDEGFAFETWIQAFCRRKFNSDFAREMSRSVGRYLEAYQGEFKAE